jgi:hypothetical protein
MPVFISLQGPNVGPGFDLGLQAGPARHFTLSIAANSGHEPDAFTVSLEGWIPSGGDDVWIKLIETSDYGVYSVSEHMVARIRANMLSFTSGSDPFAGIVAAIAVGDN